VGEEKTWGEIETLVVQRREKVRTGREGSLKRKLVCSSKNLEERALEDAKSELLPIRKNELKKKKRKKRGSRNWPRGRGENVNRISCNVSLEPSGTRKQKPIEGRECLILRNKFTKSLTTKVNPWKPKRLTPQPPHQQTQDGRR